MVQHSPSLLLTKLSVPRVRPAFVSRNSLLAALESGPVHKVILIAAAAGFGKTTLIAEWSSQYTDRVSWLSLDEGDNDPVRFLAYLIAAIQVQRPQIGQELLTALLSPQPPASEHVLPILINQLVSEHLILVLDDYHVIDNQAVHAALSFFIEHLPPHLTVVLLTRADPPLPLARLRAKNDLLEIRADRLRFSVDETEWFLNRTMQLDLPLEAIRALETRTEGWITGLQLAAIAMQTPHGDRQAFVRSFTGSHRFVLDYLIEEVLSRQTEPIRRFLLQTSILQRLSGPLCSAITGQADGQTMLATLEENNLFLIPLDQSRDWYRYHHLFAELLRVRLQAEAPDLPKKLAQRAAHWHAENGLAEDAVSYALDAEDFEFAATLITGPAAGIAQRGEVVTLLDWYKVFPAEATARDPRLCLYFGLAFALGGRWAEAETLLNYVEPVIETMPGEALMLAYLVANYRHDNQRLAAITELAQRQIDPTAKLVQALITSMDGDQPAACDLMAQAQRAAERNGDLTSALIALFHQCRLNVFAGNLHQGYELSQQALQRAADLGGLALPMVVLAHVSLGRILIEWNELESAEQHLTEAVRLSERSGFVSGTVSSGTMMLAEVRQAQGNVEAALHSAQEAIRYAEQYDPAPEVDWLKTYQARIWLCQGNLAAAVDWGRNTQYQSLPESLFYPSSIQKVTQARVLLAQRKADEAVMLLTELAAEACNLLTVETLAVLALARQAQGDNVHALLTLEQALSLAATENRVRAFLDLGNPMGRLLTSFCEAHPENVYVRQMLALFSSLPASTPAVEPLSGRELDVLRLIVAGYSNDEIAQRLTIALSTVKWYVNTLYSKLHVKTRSQAIARTHELRLLVD